MTKRRKPWLGAGVSFVVVIVLLGTIAGSVAGLAQQDAEAAAQGGRTTSGAAGQ
ncbi:hypothetical protein ACFQ6Q_19515 [Streptomyces sp. NPDC056437]|uniref:hypothetical protein n=1 Tax=Streptomyces sp. NPDC056437 TaxID=3345816 RepID=UPI003692EDB4